MATFTLTIDTDNAAFGDDDPQERRTEIRRCLDRASDAIEAGNLSGRIRDTNGNTVGSFSFDSDADSSPRAEGGSPLSPGR